SGARGRRSGSSLVQADAPSGGHGAATTAPQPHGRRPPGLTQVIPRESPPQQPGSPGAAPAASRAPPLVGHLWTAGSEAGSGTADLAVRSKTLNGKTFNPLLQFHQQMQMNRCRSAPTASRGQEAGVRRATSTAAVRS
ncbi:unnamed protein product, partial [Prorocentrum cordatum]